MSDTATWTEERIDTLKRLHAEGVSFSGIAAQLGGFGETRDGGRSACIGKAHRLGLAGKPRTPAQYAPRAPRVRPPAGSGPARMARQREMAAVLAERPEPEWQPAIITTEHLCLLHDLEDHHCRFPTWGDDAPMSERFFCGAPTAKLSEGRPYCPAHGRIAFTPAKPRTPRPYHFAEAAE